MICVSNDFLITIGDEETKSCLMTGEFISGDQWTGLIGGGLGSECFLGVVSFSLFVLRFHV